MRFKIPLQIKIGSVYRLKLIACATDSVWIPAGTKVMAIAQDYHIDCTEFCTESKTNYIIVRNDQLDKYIEYCSDGWGDWTDLAKDTDFSGLNAWTPDCEHEYVDMGFMFPRWVCKKCDKEREKQGV